MDAKKMIWVGMFIGSTIGSYLPVLWGASMFSFSSVVWSGMGGALGIWLGFRMSR